MTLESEDLFARVTLTGAGYTRELEEGLRNDLLGSMIVITRGSKGPAAGPDVAVQIALSFLADFPHDICAALISVALTKILDSIRSRARYGAELTQLSISLSNIDIEMVSVDNLTSIEGIDFVRLVGKVQEFVNCEAESGSYVCRVSAPNEIVEHNGVRKLIKRSGSMDLWEVEYRDGPRWYKAVYDAANECFLNVDEM